jgi:hypothetical protein
MLVYFHKSKFFCKKGQMAPFFILILVILIIMALVTINLSKVGFIKTDASNSVDAGALAAGSVMASVFNSLAQANSTMEIAYQEFIGTTAAQAAIATGFLMYAKVNSCPNPCGAIFAMKVYLSTIVAMLTAVAGYHMAQYYFYKDIRKAITKGRNQAVTLGHKFTFINSGTISKLRQGSAPVGVSQEARNNYREEFSGFLDNTITSDEEFSYSNEEYNYPWVDGQNRQHFVRTRVVIDPVDDYELQVTVLPLAAELAALGSALYLGYSAYASLVSACGFQKCCGNPYTSEACCPAWDDMCAKAIGEMIVSLASLGVAMAGLAPGPKVNNSLVDSAALFTICWINDIQHNRLVSVDTTQHHQGIDLGLWRMRYPDASGNTNSSSVVNFTGTGSIYPPEFRHDADIIETDR